ncbi:MAG: His/Gly/Thr/Pro-type tRNA ligase C-terminal domain-containing protein, partial [Candidatus Diapherotrites archaeon]|nr:His/Gly/Thr/Pro-type tRNA ligase C-terminal domain-containing protein [Candidatus Diapherotrites archaeon]
GDMNVNEIQLTHALKCVSVRSATPEEVVELGSVVGFVSPLKLKIRKVGDPSLKTVRNFSTGADAEKMDTLNVNYERDFTVEIMAEIALPPEKCVTPEGKPLLAGRGIEVGNIFQLGTHYTTRMKGAMFVNEKGEEVPYYMGCYGIGVGRTMGAVVEVHNDQHGIIWPKSIAPYQVHLTTIGTEATTFLAADKLHQDMLQAGIEVLYDDRDERAGVKLKDADLIGIPLRIVLSDRTYNQKSVEWKERWEEKAKGVSLDILIPEIKKWLTQPDINE